MSARYFIWITFGVYAFSTVYSSGMFRKQFPEHSIPMLQTGVDPGDPLFLTPYIEKGDIQTAQKLALVGPLEGTSVESYSGFLTVNKTFGSNMFFWYFPSQDPRAPLLLWLQGGPGGSSLFGLFVEHGPFGVDQNMKLYSRKFAWTLKYSMLYIDNPVGTGFSFTQSVDGYARNETAVATNLYSALDQFFTLFPNQKNVDFYLTGESYAGKYIPAIAYMIHKAPHPKSFTLRGVAIGDGFTDPKSMFPVYSKFLYQIGYLDANQRDYFRQQTELSLTYIAQKEWFKAFEVWDLLMNGDLIHEPSYFTNVTGSTNYYNYLESKEPTDYGYSDKYLSLPEVRRAIHVGNLTFNTGQTVEKYLVEDMAQSVKPWLEEVMNYYKVLLYSGHLDIIVALPLTEAMLETMYWVYADEYKLAKRYVWKVNPTDVEVAGYVKHVHDFYQVSVRNAGHIVPADQPERAFDMIDRFITGRPFY